MSGTIDKPIEIEAAEPSLYEPESVRGWEHWNEDDYLAFDENIPVEFSRGKAEVLPIPTMLHQLILAYLHAKLFAFVSERDLGTVLFSAFRIRLRAGKYREPDLVFMRIEHSNRMGEVYWEGADLVMEIVFENREHDLITKRQEYAEAGVPEYWIVDPREGRITVLRLEVGSNVYAEHGIFERGSIARSALLDGFEVDVNEALTTKR